MIAAPRPRPGAPLPEHTAWHRRRHEEHERAEHASRTGLQRSHRPPSFRPLPAGELAPLIRRHNDERAERSADRELHRTTAVNILTACDHLRDAVAAGAPIAPSTVDMFQEVVREFLALTGAVRSARRRDGVAAMHEALESLHRSLGR